MRAVLLLSMALAAAPLALAQQSTDKAPQASKPSATTAAKPAAAKAGDKAARSEGATAVRSTPADMKKGGEGKNYEGCGHGKMAASDA